MTTDGTKTLFRAGSLRLSVNGSGYRITEERDGTEKEICETDDPDAAVSSFCGTVELRIRRAIRKGNKDE